MKGNKDKLWQAYLDGELSVTEMAEFEETLGPDERAALAADRRFEAGLADALSRGAACPDDVWARTRALIVAKAEGGPPQRSRARRWYWGASMTAAAAIIAFAIAQFVPSDPSRLDSATVINAETVSEAMAMMETAPGVEQAQQFLRLHHVHLKFNAVDTLGLQMILHHDIEVLGAREERAGGQPVVSIYFACCLYPVKVVVAEEGSRGADALGRSAAQGGQVQAIRVFGRYVTAVVGKHHAHGLLDIFANDENVKT